MRIEDPNLRGPEGLHPFFAFEVEDLEEGDCGHEHEAHGVAEGVMEFWHVPRHDASVLFRLEIHTPDSR